MDLEQQLSAALAPRRPGPELRVAVMARVSATAASVRSTRRKPGGPILLGTILAVAAAAALLAMHLMGTTASQPVAVTLPLVPAAPAPISEPVAKVVEVSTSTKQVTPALQPLQDEPAPTEALPAIKPFTVLVLPLRLETQDPGLGNAAREFYNSALDELRSIPGVLLVGADPSSSVPAEPADFRLAFTGSAGYRIALAGSVDGARQIVTATPDATGHWRMGVKVESPRSRSPTVVVPEGFAGYVQSADGAMVPMLSSDGQAMSGVHAVQGVVVADATQSSPQSAGDYQHVFSTTSSGAMTADCDEFGQTKLPDGICSIPAYAAALVEQLRMNVFPVDSSLERKLQTRLFDRHQSYTVRLAALQSLRQLQQRKHAAGLNADVIHGALDLMAEVPDASSRTQVQNLLRGQIDPALLQSAGAPALR